MENTKKIKIKKAVNIAVNVVLWLFVIFAVIVTVIAVSANANKKNVPTVGGTCYLSVQSDSMNAAKPEWAGEDKPDGFKKGDMLKGKYIAEDSAAIGKLAVGDVITFEWDINGDGVVSQGEYNTHRIVNIVTRDDGSVEYFETQGDNIEYTRGKSEQVYASRVIAKYEGKKIGGMGKFFDTLRSPLGFALIIILPIAAFFVYELVVFIRTVIKIKNDGKKTITAEDEEVIKQRAIEEYIRMQQSEKSGENDSKKSSD